MVGCLSLGLTPVFAASLLAHPMSRSHCGPTDAGRGVTPDSPPMVRTLGETSRITLGRSVYHQKKQIVKYQENRKGVKR